MIGDDDDDYNHVTSDSLPRDGRIDLHAPSLYPRDDASETHHHYRDDDDDEVGCERSVSRIETEQQGDNVIGIDATHQ